MTSKKCTGCKQIKNIEAFGKNKGTPDKYNYYCKECRNERYRNNTAKNKEYSQRPEVKKQRRETEKKRFNSRPDLKLNRVIKAQITNELKKHGKKKDGKSTFKYLPYSVEELKAHIESQFEKWMNWDNWGIYSKDEWNDNDMSTWTWQIDHIVTRNELPYKSMEDENFTICWSLSNLRPLNAKINIIEGARRLKGIGRYSISMEKCKDIK